jgi:membrane AbrB-like protein
VVGLPLPWMLGPMLVCAVAALGGAPLAGPQTLRPVVIPVLGVMLGSGFSPEILGQLGAWAGTFALLPVFVAVSGLTSWLYYVRVGRYDRRTAFFCAAPGGLNEMILLGAENGGDERRIALAHAVRVFLVIALIALAFAALEGTTTAGLADAHTGFGDLAPRDAVLLLGCALVGVPAARLARLPAPGLFGPMVLSAALHIGGTVTVPPPTPLVVVAQLIIGTVLGCRFVGSTFRETGRDILLGAGASALLLAITVVFAVTVASVSAAPWTQAILAYAPGGLAEMSLLALAKNQDVAYVATAHVTRIVVVLFAVRPVFRALGDRLPPA